MSIDALWRVVLCLIVACVWLKGCGTIQSGIKDGSSCTRFDGLALTGGCFSSAAQVWRQRLYFRAAVVVVLLRLFENLRS